MSGLNNNTRQKEFINHVLDQFYTLAVSDFLIGYQFRKIRETVDQNVDDFLFPPLQAFSSHLKRIHAFWHMQLLGEKRPSDMKAFDLIEAHRYLRINSGELDRWVMLFKITLEKELKFHQNAETRELSERWLNKVELFQSKMRNYLI